MAHSKKRKLVVPARCTACGRPFPHEDGVVASSTYCRECSHDRLATAKKVLGLRPITSADFDGPYLIRQGR